MAEGLLTFGLDAGGELFQLGGFEAGVEELRVAGYVAAVLDHFLRGALGVGGDADG